MVVLEVYDGSDESIDNDGSDGGVDNDGSDGGASYDGGDGGVDYDGGDKLLATMAAMTAEMEVLATMLKWRY